MDRPQTDIIEILDTLIDQYAESGIMIPGFRGQLMETAKQILSHTDTRYVPGYKLTTLMADLVNVAASIAAEGWLSDVEAREQLAQLTALDSPLITHFLQEARLERARYEPVMLRESSRSPLEHRNAVLGIRLSRMIAARQKHDPLPDAYIHTIIDAAESAMLAAEFAQYREGAMLQLFAEMIEQADAIADTTFDELEGMVMLIPLLSDNGRLWRTFKMKSARFMADADDPLRTGIWPEHGGRSFIIHPSGTRPQLH